MKLGWFYKNNGKSLMILGLLVIFLNGLFFDLHWIYHNSKSAVEALGMTVKIFIPFIEDPTPPYNGISGTLAGMALILFGYAVDKKKTA